MIFLHEDYRVSIPLLKTMPLEINEEIIEDDLIEEELGYALQHWGRPPSAQEKETLLQTVKENLVYKTLLRQETEKMNLSIPPEHIDREYRIFFGGKTPPGGEEIAKKYIEKKIRESYFIEQLCRELSPPQDSHLRTFYHDNLEHYRISQQFHYREIGFRYPEKDLHPRIHGILSQMREELKKASSLTEYHPRSASQNPDWEKLEPYFFTREWKTEVEKLSQEGLRFFQHLEKEKISSITDHSGESLLFTPVKREEIPDAPSLTHYLGIFFHMKIRTDFIPDFEEVAERVRNDLWEEMRQIKVKAHLHKVMGKSTIRDIGYI